MIAPADDGISVNIATSQGSAYRLDLEDTELCYFMPQHFRVASKWWTFCNSVWSSLSIKTISV
jgi:hypothetical protein